MDHSEVRELLEDAAIEPGGLERLMAGDTTTASLVAGHLAGCADCSEELERLRRSVGLIRPTVQLVPPPELKERTLAYVAMLGRPRGAAVAASQTRAEAGAPTMEPAAPVRMAPAHPADRRRQRDGASRQRQPRFHHAGPGRRGRRPRRRRALDPPRRCPARCPADRARERHRHARDRQPRLLADVDRARRRCRAPGAGDGRPRVPLLGRRRRPPDGHRQDVLRGRPRLLGR